MNHIRLYRRENMGELKPSQNRSLLYSRREAKKMFDRYPTINTVEYVVSGRKSDSKYLKLGQKVSPEGVAVIIASTSGKWGKSRRDYLPF